MIDRPFKDFHREGHTEDYASSWGIEHDVAVIKDDVESITEHIEAVENELEGTRHALTNVFLAVIIIICLIPFFVLAVVTDAVAITLVILALLMAVSIYIFMQTGKIWK